MTYSAESNSRNSAGPALSRSLGARPHVVEPNQINILASTMLRHLEQVQNAKKPGFARQLRSDIRESDSFNGIDFNRAFLHGVSPADSHVRTRPYPYAASDLSAANFFAQSLRENHEESLPQSCGPLSPGLAWNRLQTITVCRSRIFPACRKPHSAPKPISFTCGAVRCISLPIGRPNRTSVHAAASKIS